MTVTQNAQAAAGSQQTRSFAYDGLGRMTSETNPESGSVSYTYDSDTTCGTSIGDLVKRTDGATNVTCNSYDAMHRVTSISYPSGPNTANTPSKGFIYDAYSGAANAKARLAVAYTCNGNPSTCSTWLTSELYSYSARGEVVDFYEATPHSSGAYDVKQSYWEDGASKQLSNLPGLPAITYGGTIGSTVGLDGEGRFTQVTAASGQNPMTGVTYVNSGTTQPIGALTQVNFGSLDYDQFSFDPNTSRQKQYVFNVNGQTDAGTLTWNANGSLKQFAIADTVPGAVDSQTCNYTHDDLGRIASVDCGSSNWQQNFSYDAFGNIAKTVPAGGTGISFPPTHFYAYNTATNRINLTGYTYDNNGNLVTDATGSHQYSWDADGNPTCVDNVVITYDASGRAVEQARGGSDCTHPGTSYQQIVYSPGGGKLALMNGQTLTKAFVPLPGGATAVYTSTGLAYYRHSDHLGSSRLATTPSRGPYYTGAYAPFGENYKENGTTDRSFTGQNQDTAGGAAPLYDFMFREDTPNQGRWISPDPAGIGAADPADPQSWNRYAYVSNSPLNSVDPLGLVVFPGRDCLLDNNGYCTSWGRDGQMGGGGGWFGGLISIGAMGIGIEFWKQIVVGSLPAYIGDQPHGVEFPIYGFVRSEVWISASWSPQANIAYPRAREGGGSDGAQWWKDFGKALIHPDNSIKLTGFGGCLEDNRLDNAVQALGEAYGHPTAGKVASYVTLGTTGAAIANSGANYAFGAAVPALLGRSAHSSTWLRALGYRTAGRAAAAVSAVLIVGEGAYDATAMVRCAVTSGTE